MNYADLGCTDRYIHITRADGTEVYNRPHLVDRRPGDVVGDADDDDIEGDD